MEGAPQEGQGRVHGLDRHSHADTSREEEVAGARVDFGGHGRLEAWLLLGFFVHPEEEEEEEEAVKRTESGAWHPLTPSWVPYWSWGGGWAWWWSLVSDGHLFLVPS